MFDFWNLEFMLKRLNCLPTIYLPLDRLRMNCFLVNSMRSVIGRDEDIID